jgi:hypothetical protein
MIDNNGQYTLMELTTAQEKVLANATASGVEVLTNSPESQIANWMAQVYLLLDTERFKSYQKQFAPTGNDLDQQNPGTPRKAAAITQGPLVVSNSTGAAILIPINHVFTAPNGNTYTNGSIGYSVPATGSIGITVFSQVAGINQNIPANQTFTVGISGLTASNPQPFTIGRDAETDTQYDARIIDGQTNHTSEQATLAAEAELKKFYPDARFYVNNTNNAFPNPVKVPPNGYISVVQFPSGALPSLAEQQNAFGVLSRRFEFGNAYNQNTALHPVLSGVVYSGIFPQTYFLVPAQVVSTTLVASVQVRFAKSVDNSEKAILTSGFAQFFAQNMVSYFGGATGDAVLNFTLNGGSPVAYPLPVVASQGIVRPIAPAFSIQQLAALISDANKIPSLPNFEYVDLTAFTCALNPLVGGEATITLNIAGPTKSIDFTKTALFTDGSAWWDRYVFINPAQITVNAIEVL